MSRWGMARLRLALGHQFAKECLNDGRQLLRERGLARRLRALRKWGWVVLEDRVVPGGGRVPFLLVGPPGLLLVTPVPARRPLTQAYDRGPLMAGRTDLTTWSALRQAEHRAVVDGFVQSVVPDLTVRALVTTSGSLPKARSCRPNRALVRRWGAVDVVPRVDVVVWAGNLGGPNSPSQVVALASAVDAAFRASRLRPMALPERE